ncbi:hypothetical protein [Gordonia sp. NPDC058843]|uniref:hypothetical protein n=1 Tax=Gordonia sp. NPDC058843 TaxID=3346648 RepID=UPI003680E76F
MLRALVFTSICAVIDVIRAQHTDLSAGARDLMALLTENRLDGNELKAAREHALRSTKNSVKWTMWCAVIILAIAALFEFIPAVPRAIGAVLTPIANLEQAGFLGFVIAAAVTAVLTAGLQKIVVPGAMEDHPPLRYSLTIGRRASDHFAVSMRGTLDLIFGAGTTHRQQRQVIRTVRKRLWVRSAAALTFLVWAVAILVTSMT